mgnify:CR=1 FL=1
MWALSSEVNNPVVVKTLSGEWYSFNMNQNQVGLFFDDLIIDQFNQKWGVLGQGKGLFVFNDKLFLILFSAINFLSQKFHYRELL